MKKLLAVALLAMTALTAGNAIAATDGTLGATSTGTSPVTLTIPELFRISSLADFALGAYAGTGTMTSNDDVCVYHNGDGTYQVTGTDDSTGATFAVENAGNTAVITMEVKWNDITGTAGNAALIYNTAMPSTAANTTIDDCSVGGLSGNLQVNFTQADLQAAPVGAYDSTITLLVEPS